MSIKAKIPVFETFDIENQYFYYQKMMEAHGQVPVERELIPPTSVIGFIDECPHCVCMVYYCQDTPVAFVHGLVMAPGTSLAQARVSIRTMLEWIDFSGTQNKALHLMTTIPDGAMIREAERLGWHVMGEPQVAIRKFLCHKSPQSQALPT